MSSVFVCSGSRVADGGSEVVHLGDDLEGRATALTVADVARLLNVSQRQIYKLASDDKIPCFRIGGSVRFDPSTIAQWLRQTMTTSKKMPLRRITPLHESARKRA